jgi:hypothetical protein
MVTEGFLRDFAAVWQEKGTAALNHVADNDPSTFIRVGASLVPKQVKAEVNQLRRVVVELVGVDDAIEGEFAPVPAVTRSAMDIESDIRQAIEDRNDYED